MGLAGIGVKADDAAVTARFQCVRNPFMGLETNRRLREENAAVVADVQVVGQAQPAVVIDRRITAVGFVGDLLDLALGCHAVQTHATHADVQVLMAVQRQAQRNAADMGKYFHALIVRCKEPDDVTVARARVEVVVPIQDDVFRAFDATQADRRSGPQAVVQCPRSAAVGCGRRHRRHAVVGRADVDRIDDAVPVFQPADVHHRSQQQHARQHHAVVAALHRHGGQAVDDQQHDQGADQRLRYRALAAPQADPAQHRGGNHRELEALAYAGAGRGQPRGEEDSTHSGQHAAGHVTHRHRGAHRDAGVVSRAARPADSRDMPARAQAGQEDVAENRHRHIKINHRRHTEPVATANEIPHRRIGLVVDDGSRVVGDQQVVEGAVDDQRDQGGEEGAQPEVADQNAVDRAERRATQQRDHDRRADRPLQHMHQVQGA